MKDVALNIVVRRIESLTVRRDLAQAKVDALDAQIAKQERIRAVMTEHGDKA